MSITTTRPADLFTELERVGVRLWAAGAGLGYEAPPGVLRPEVLAEMKASKRELLALLAQVEAVPAEAQARARVALGPRVPVAEVSELAAALLACDQEEAVWLASGSPRRFPDTVDVGELCRQGQVLEEAHR